VSNHYGNVGFGHYTAYAKNNGKWYCFDDSRVNEEDPKNVVTDAAYMLLYKRRDENCKEDVNILSKDI
jgi:ubiquitin carboxyl-terminal hydrolase 4/11/15